MVEDYGTHLKHYTTETTQLSLSKRKRRNRVARKRSQGEAVTGRR